MNKSKGQSKFTSNKSNCHAIMTEIETLANNRKDNGKDKSKVRT